MRDLNVPTEIIIQLVKDRPVLWDKTCENYTDRREKMKAWEEVCIAGEKNYETFTEEEKSLFLKEVQKRWVNTRDAFAQCVRRQRKEKRTGIPSNKKKYMYSPYLEFLRKIYDGNYSGRENKDEGEDNSVLRASGIPRIPKNTIYSPTCSRDTKSLSDAEGGYALTSAEKMPTVINSSNSVHKRLKMSDNSELQTSKAPDFVKTVRHLSFFKGIIRSLEKFNKQEVFKFQMGVLQLVGNINDERHKPSHSQFPPQFFQFPSQSGTSQFLPSDPAAYPPGQPMFRTCWPAACCKCKFNPVHRESISNAIHRESTSTPVHREFTSTPVHREFTSTPVHREFTSNSVHLESSSDASSGGSTSNPID